MLSLPGLVVIEEMLGNTALTVMLSAIVADVHMDRDIVVRYFLIAEIANISIWRKVVLLA